MVRGGGSIAGREEWTLLGFFWVDAIEGNEEALQEEREKLRRRKAREERLAAEHQAQLENQRLQREAEEHEQLLRQREEASRNRREEMQRKVKAVQRKVLTQIASRGGSSVHSLGRTFQVCCQVARQEPGVAATSDCCCTFRTDDGPGQVVHPRSSRAGRRDVETGIGADCG